MTTLDYLEKIDDTLARWEDYFHGQEGTDVIEARANLDKVRKQLLIHSVCNHVFCPHCGDKRQLIVETDLNSGRVCKSRLCKGK
jgi:hypothetical protein